MGVVIKRNKKGEYKLSSSTSDETLHQGWVSENDAKKILIEMAYWDFVKKTIQISMDFPNEYHVNGKRQISKNEEEHMKGLRWIVSNWNGEKFKAKFNEICKELDIDINNIL